MGPAGAELPFQAAHRPRQIVEAALDRYQVVVHGHDVTSLPGAGWPWVVTFMRLRVLRVTPADVKPCAAIGGLRASVARPHALCSRRDCAARVGFDGPRRRVVPGRSFCRAIDLSRW